MKETLLKRIEINSKAMAGKEVCAWAHREERVIITNDKDFAKLVFQGRLASRGASCCA